MIPEQRAVELVTELLASRSSALGIAAVEEHELGWLVHLQSTEYSRTGDLLDQVIGQGPWLVDRDNGGVHEIPVVTYGGDWARLYRTQIKGIQPPDPLLPAVRETLAAGGTAAAVRYVRERAPQVPLPAAKAYVDAVRAGAEPEALVHEQPQEFLLPIGTLREGV
ncbi:YrhB domain-containing protein [Actinoplanes sp. N902-109]|uniref:YrhB domain-containing protein n=1 Tax=Actinoplanes sp. (strain N902-109) TaxID=649831 RepID=UPI0003294E75|nr:YrhB domain-containing protein [Actinoplanes sp. N902-109]AGL15124.1 hypothetical protein L083_1614 [Actinoplanes sp. N902-109]